MERVGAIATPIYDPDAEVQSGPPQNKMLLDLRDPTVEIDARLYEINPLMRQYRTVRYRTRNAIVKRLDEVESKFKKLQEAGLREGWEPGDLFSLGYDQAVRQYAASAAGGWLNEEFLPMMPGPFSRQLYLPDLLDQHRKCFHAVNHHPVARQIVNITTMFVLGKGVTHWCRSERAQKVWDAFVKANDLDERLYAWSNELTLYGELMLWWKPGLKGVPKIRAIDPATVWEIVTDPDDIERVYFYHQQYPTPTQMFTPAGVPSQMYIVRQIPAEEMLHVKINVTSGEKRGRSDLYPVLGWLKRLSDFYTAEVVRVKMQASFLWDDTIDGDEKDVQEHIQWLRANPPMPGETFVHNKSVTRQFLSPAGRGVAMHEEGAAILNLIGVGVGIPKEYLGVSIAGSRATALVATEPAAKKFEARQQVLEWMLHRIADRVFEAAGLPEEEREIEFSFPSIASEDRTGKLRDLALAESMAWISHKTAASIVAKELQITTYDYAQAMEEIKAELGGANPENMTAAAFQMVPKIPPSPPPGAQDGKGPSLDGQEVQFSDPLGAALAAAMKTKAGWKPGEKAENNPMNPEGAGNLKKQLAKKESLREQAPQHKPGYRTVYGQRVEDAISMTAADMEGVITRLAPALGALDEPVDRTRLIEFLRRVEKEMKEKLLRHGAQVYQVGIEKGVDAIGRDRSSTERHAVALDTWYRLALARIDELLHEMEDQTQEEEGVTVAGFLDRWRPAAAALGLGLWTLYHLGFRQTISGGGLDEEELAQPVMVNYIAVGDENTCPPCADTMAKNPWPAHAVPLPGEVCLGRERCRCEIELA